MKNFYTDRRSCAVECCQASAILLALQVSLVCKVPSTALLITPTKVWKTVALKALKDLESMILGPNPGNELATATDVRTSSFCGFDGVHAGYRDELRRTDVQHEPSSISLLYRGVDSKPRQGRYMWVLEKGLTNTVFAFNHSSEEVFTFWIQASNQTQTHKSTLKVIFADGFLWQTLQLVRIVKFLYPKVRPLMGKCRRGMDVEILASCRMSAHDWYFNKTYTGLLLLLTIRQGIVSIASNIRLSIVWSINSISGSVFESLASLVLCMKLWNG